MEEAGKTESHMTSAAAFVEGGIQPACDDACSICLEPFCESDPSTVTGCKHEFHLQCILEWCQRSSQCPMCWQSISLKDPTSQELLEAVERERSLRLTPARNGTIFRHPALGDFELQHLPAGANDAELEERIMQHLAAAAAMGRAHHIARREGQRSRSSANGRPHYLVFSTHPSAPPAGGETESATNCAASPSVQFTSGSDESSRQSPLFSMVHPSHVAASASGSRADVNSAAGQSSTPSLDRAGPSDFQSFSESVKSRLTAASTRYKESISKSTKGWREKLFSRNTSMADLGSEVRREVSAGIASVSRMMEHLETRQTRLGELNQQDTGSNGEDGLNDGDTPPHAASSVSN